MYRAMLVPDSMACPPDPGKRQTVPQRLTRSGRGVIVQTRLCDGAIQVKFEISRHVPGPFSRCKYACLRFTEHCYNLSTILCEGPPLPFISRALS